MDISEYAREFVPENCEFRVGDVREIPFENDFFDAVILSHVIEHIPIEHVPIAIGEVYRILKEGGLLYIETPSSSNNFFWDVYTHVRPYSGGSLRHMLTTGNFKNIITGGGAPLYLRWRYYKLFSAMGFKNFALKIASLKASLYRRLKRSLIFVWAIGEK